MTEAISSMVNKYSQTSPPIPIPEQVISENAEQCTCSCSCFKGRSTQVIQPTNPSNSASQKGTLAGPSNPQQLTEQKALIIGIPFDGRPTKVTKPIKKRILTAPQRSSATFKEKKRSKAISDAFKALNVKLHGESAKNVTRMSTLCQAIARIKSLEKILKTTS